MTKLCAKHRRKADILWSICANKDEWVCDRCDIELNKIALKWRFPKTWKRKLEAYKRRVGI